jgi:hypothetical protein
VQVAFIVIALAGVGLVMVANGPGAARLSQLIRAII